VDTWYVVLLTGAGLLSAAGPIVWASAILQTSGDICGCNDPRDDAASTDVPPERIIHHLDSTLAQLERLIHSACRRYPGPLALRRMGLAVSPYKQLRIQNMFMETHNCIRRLEAARRARYELRVADLIETAACVGINWSPGPGHD